MLHPFSGRPVHAGASNSERYYARLSRRAFVMFLPGCHFILKGCWESLKLVGMPCDRIKCYRICPGAVASHVEARQTPGFKLSYMVRCSLRAGKLLGRRQRPPACGDEEPCRMQGARCSWNRSRAAPGHSAGPGIGHRHLAYLCVGADLVCAGLTGGQVPVAGGHSLQGAGARLLSAF